MTLLPLTPVFQTTSVLLDTLYFLSSTCLTKYLFFGYSKNKKMLIFPWSWGFPADNRLTTFAKHWLQVILVRMEASRCLVELQRKFSRLWYNISSSNIFDRYYSIGDIPNLIWWFRISHKHHQHKNLSPGISMMWNGSLGISFAVNFSLWFA